MYLLRGRLFILNTVSITVVCKQKQFTDKTTHRQQAKRSVKSISHIIWYINPQILFVDICWGHGMSLTVFSHCDLDLRNQVLKKCTHSWSPLLSMVAVPYLVCRYILGPGESPTVFMSLWPWPLVSVLARSSPEHICIKFEVGIPNLAWGYILVSWHVAYTSARLYQNGHSCNLLINCQVNKVNSPVCPTSMLHRRQKGCA